MRRFRSWRRTGAAALLSALAMWAQAQGVTRVFDIPGGDMKAALDAYIAQSGVQLLYRTSDIQNLRSKGAKGSLSVESALNALIEGSRLQVRRDDNGAVVLVVPPPGAADAGTPSSETVVVTGSRLKATQLLSSSPMTVVSSAELQAGGAVSVENVLNTLPQMTASQSGSQSTFGTTGTAALNLRNLGPQRTLVLIDGRRLPPGDPLFPVADVNFVPLPLVKAVDVVTGGASAVYGSDAVAGVVNFRLQRNFEGVLADLQLGGAQHTNDNGSAQAALRARGVGVPGDKWDAFNGQFSLLGGLNFGGDGGNVTAYLTYAAVKPVLDSARDWAACGIGTVGGAAPLDTHACQGSSNSAFGRLRTNGGGTGLSANPDGSASFVTYNAATMGYNSNELTYLQREDKRLSAGVLAAFRLSPAVELYGDLMLMRDRTVAQLSPAGNNASRTYTINCDNPLLSASQATALCGANAGNAASVWRGTFGYRFADGGQPRQDHLSHDSSRTVAGARGELGAGWSYDVAAQYGQVDFESEFLYDVSVTRIQRALLVRNRNGTPACTSAIDGTDPACVPLNLFQLGKATPAFGYLYDTAYKRGHTRQAVLTGNVTGELGRLSPLAREASAVALGVESRRDALSLNYSENLFSGDLAGSGISARPAQGKDQVSEAYGEVRLPLVQGRPGIDNLSLDAGYRLSHYERAGTAHTYKLNLSFAPVADVGLRAGYNRAVRAPNLVELFAPVMVATAAGNDPCAGASPTASLASCANSGVTAAQYRNIPDCPSGFCNVQTGGNLALRPEEADTYTVGLVFTPTAVRGLSATLDAFDIRVDGIIGTVPSALVLSQCLNNNNPYYCAQIRRNASGSLATDGGFIVGTNQNTGYRRVRGIDLGSNYRFPLGEALGTAALDFAGTWVHTQRIEPAPGQGSYDCAGLYGPTCGVPTPTWRHKLRTTWETPWQASVWLNWRHIGSTQLDGNSGNALMSAATGGVYNVADARIRKYDYFDVGAVVRLTAQASLRVGINNVFDRDPPVLDNYNFPIITSVGNGNTYSGLYDTLGRSFHVAFSVKF